MSVTCYYLFSPSRINKPLITMRNHGRHLAIHFLIHVRGAAGTVASMDKLFGWMPRVAIAYYSFAKGAYANYKMLIYFLCKKN